VKQLTKQRQRQENRDLRRTPGDARNAVSQRTGYLRVGRFLMVPNVAASCLVRGAARPLSVDPAPLPVLLVSGRRCVPMRAAATLRSLPDNRRRAGGSPLGMRQWASGADSAGTRGPNAAPCENQRSDLREPLHVRLLGHRAGARGGPARSPRAPGATQPRRSFASRVFRAIRARCPQDTDQQQRITSLLRAVPSSRPELRTRPDRWCP
jgi:hypothetical protein